VFGEKKGYSLFERKRICSKSQQRKRKKQGIAKNKRPTGKREEEDWNKEARPDINRAHREGHACEAVRWDVQPMYGNKKGSWKGLKK